MKCMIVVAATLCVQRISIYTCIDKWLLVESFPPTSRYGYTHHTLITQRSGSLCKSGKILTHPNSEYSIIGMQINTIQKILPAEEQGHHFLNTGHSSIQQAYSIQPLIGLMASIILVGFLATLWMRPLQFWFFRHYNPLLSTTVPSTDRPANCLCATLLMNILGPLLRRHTLPLTTFRSCPIPRCIPEGLGSRGDQDGRNRHCHLS